MKYDINKELTRGAKRTLNDFKNIMFTLLSEKSFEEITVGELCKRANYPRATFSIGCRACDEGRVCEAMVSSTIQ